MEGNLGIRVVTKNQTYSLENKPDKFIK